MKCEICSKETFSRSAIHRLCRVTSTENKAKYSEATFLITKEEAEERYNEAVRRISLGEDTEEMWRERRRMWAILTKTKVTKEDTIISENPRAKG